MTIYLYVKTHTITGLKYLGKTNKKNYHKYLGSGTYWLRHLKTHGESYTTEILRECIDNEDIKKWGLYYSKLWDVVKSNNWANLIDESGAGGSCPGKLNGMYGRDHTPETKILLSELCKERFTRKSYLEIYGKEKSQELKLKRSVSSKFKNNSYKHNPRFDENEYKFFNIQTGELLLCTRWVFMKQHKLNRGGVSDMINWAITYKNWCILLY